MEERDSPNLKGTGSGLTIAHLERSKGGHTGLLSYPASRTNWREEKGVAIFLSDERESCSRKPFGGKCDQARKLRCSSSLKSESDRGTWPAHHFGALLPKVIYTFTEQESENSFSAS